LDNGDGRKEGLGEEFRPTRQLARFLKTAKEPVKNMGSNFMVAKSKLFFSPRLPRPPVRA